MLRHYAMGVTLTPIKGLRLQGILKMYDKNYSDWSPTREYDGSDVDVDRSPSIGKNSGYNRLDLHGSYKLPKIGGLDMSINVSCIHLDLVYVQDKLTIHNIMDLVINFTYHIEVFLGTPRYVNIGLVVNF